MSNTIIRGIHDKDNPYYVASRKTAQDDHLSYEALGLLTYLLSKPDNWRVQIDDLIRPGCGRDKVYRIIAELKQTGYLTRVKKQNAKGQWTWEPYKLYEAPQLAAGSESSPFPENPYTVEPDTEKPEISTQSTDKQSIEETESAPSGAQSSKPAKKAASRKATAWEAHFLALVAAFGLTPDTLAKSASGLYWKVAHELYDVSFPPERIAELYRYVRELSVRGEWAGFTIAALAKYSADFLRDHPAGGDSGDALMRGLLGPNGFILGDPVWTPERAKRDAERRQAAAS